MNSEIMDIFISAMMIAIAQTNHMAFFFIVYFNLYKEQNIRE